MCPVPPGCRPCSLPPPAACVDLRAADNGSMHRAVLRLQFPDGTCAFGTAVTSRGLIITSPLPVLGDDGALKPCVANGIKVGCMACVGEAWYPFWHYRATLLNGRALEMHCTRENTFVALLQISEVLTNPIPDSLPEPTYVPVNAHATAVYTGTDVHVLGYFTTVQKRINTMCHTCFYVTEVDLIEGEIEDPHVMYLAGAPVMTRQGTLVGMILGECGDEDYPYCVVRRLSAVPEWC